ncbi:hypothetical protein [Amycolatopsis sp. NBRC 101858]|nr:hypothetical protein [Amycolatopsis sp. NBRC 101858]
MTKDLERERAAAEPHAGQLLALGTHLSGLPADRYRPEGDPS